MGQKPEQEASRPDSSAVFEILNWGHEANEKALFDYLHMFHINFFNECNIYEIEPIDDLDLSFSRSSKFQDQQINWMAKYDFLYLFHNMHHLELPWFDLS